MEGNYNSTNFFAAFKSAFSAAGHGKALTISINKLTGRLTFTLSGIYTLIIKNTYSTMFSVLGFSVGTDYTITSSLQAPYPMNLLGVKKINIFSSALANFSFDSGSLTESNLVQTITVNDSQFGVVSYLNQFDSYGRLRASKINEIDVQLRDENNALIDFNGIDWALCFQLDIYRYISHTSRILNIVGGAEPPLPPVQEVPPQDLVDSGTGDDILDLLTYK
jgi:hypothetical protein